MSVHIRTRRSESKKNGKVVRYQVLFRRGGRAYKKEDAGTFRSRKDAERRARRIGVWLDDGKDPRDELRALTAAPVERLTFNQWAERYLAARKIDLKNTNGIESAIKNLNATFGETDPQELDRGQRQDGREPEGTPTGLAPSLLDSG
jgi:hypothetical protein